jgi:dihydrolipoamide dehydrogenase
LLKVENADINVNDRGYIEVDEYQRTSQKNIFAIGDIVGNPMLAHKATHEGKVAAEVASGHPAVMDPKAIPSVVYTDPEVAWTGLTETEAKKDKIPYEKGEFPWAASGKAQILNASQGKTKILFDPETKQVLGAGIVGPSAGDLICEAALAIEMGSDAEDIGLTVHPHPTLGETFAAAAEVYLGTMTDLYTPSK